jgi:hypothetical protein
MKCSKKVSDFTGFHFYPCGKPAKFRVWFGDGPVVHYCGVHANQAKRREGSNVVPLADSAQRR